MSGKFQQITKRVFDIVVSVGGLLLLSPLLALIALALKVQSADPVFFRQERPGYRGRRFRICKFRTMTETRNSSGQYLPDAERLTRFGLFLRHTSLDELPELINVLRGDMSLVGPRPLLTHYESLYTPEQARRQEVRPGITGLAQISGRNALTWEQKFELDVWYVDHWTLWLDWKILCLTGWMVLRGAGINQPGQATAEEFKGTSR